MSTATETQTNTLIELCEIHKQDSNNYLKTKRYERIHNTMHIKDKHEKTIIHFQNQ
jgi:hypothetical protein